MIRFYVYKILCIIRGAAILLFEHSCVKFAECIALRGTDSLSLTDAENWVIDQIGVAKIVRGLPPHLPYWSALTQKVKS